MKLEKAGEVVSDAAKLTRLIHPNQCSGSMYDKLGMTIYTTPNITFEKASGLFEGMEHAGLAPVPPTDSVNYSNAKDKGHTPTSESPTENLIKRNPTQGPIMPVDRYLSLPARITNPETAKRKCPICDDPNHFAYQYPHLDKARSSIKKSRRSTSSWGEEEGDDGDVVSA
jgi:hypothetical protein